tara:strand:- start:5 stop:376 length:372 start_codon:yes stop_codon:yes gene_type:complete
MSQSNTNGKTFSLDATRILEKLDSTSDLRIGAFEKALKLDKMEKVVIAKLKIDIRKGYDKISQADLTDKAYAHPTYRKWLDAYVKWETKNQEAKDGYNHAKVESDLAITTETSSRYFSNKLAR